MKRLKFAAAVMAPVLFGASAAQAVDNYWTGAVNGTWDTSTLNWAITGSGTACKWTRPSDTTIDTAKFAASSPMTISAGNDSLYVTSFFANIEENKDVTIEVNKNNGIWGVTSPVRKTGPGQLTISSVVPKANGKVLFVIPGKKVNVEEGTLKVVSANQVEALAPPGNASGRTPAAKMTEYDVYPGATFWIGSRGMTGNANYGSGMRLRLRDGAALKVGPDTSGNDMNCVPIDELLLEGGTVSFGGKAHSNFGILGAGSLLKLTGTNACTLATGGEDTRSFILGYGGNAVGNLFQDHTPPVIDVADVTADDKVDLDIDMPIGRNGAPGANMVCFDKTGAGTLRFSYKGTPASHGINGNLKIKEGDVQFYGMDSFQQHKDSTVYVSTNATLTFATVAATANLSGLSNGRSKARMHFDHATFLLKPRIANYNDMGDVGYCYLGKELTMENSRLDAYVASYRGDKEDGLGALIAGDLVHAKAVAGESWTADWTPRNQKIGNQTLQINAPETEFRVDDTTDDGNVDMSIGFRLVDFCKYQGKMETSSFLKTGAGTLMLTNRLNNVSSVEVREGTLLVKNPAAGATYGDYVALNGDKRSYLGNNGATNGVVLVTTNGTLKIDRICQYAGVSYGDGSGHKVYRPLVVDGGLVDISGNAGNGNACFQPFGPVTLKNGGRLDYANSRNDLGVFGVHGKLKVEGTAPVTLPAATSGGKSRIFLWPNYQTQFDIADVTGDLETDFTTHLCPGMPGNATYFDGADSGRGKGQPGNTWRYGWTKTGDGTMALNYCDEYRFHTLPAIVSNGTLLVNADFARTITLSNVKHDCAGFEVRSGALIGGTGKVASLSLDEGAGFFAVGEQSLPLVSEAKITLPKKGKIVLKVPQGGVTKRTQIVRSLAGFEGAENLADWTVEAPGHSADKFRITLRNNTLSVGAGLGLSLFVR